VRVVSARVGKVDLQSPFSEGGSLTKEPLLAITLELTNVSQNRKLDYHTGRELISLRNGMMPPCRTTSATPTAGSASA